MKPRLFIDTGAFYAKYVARDAHHKTALRLWDRVRTERVPCLTTNLVLAELVTLLVYRFGNAAALQAAREIHASHAITVVYVEESLTLQALDWLARFADQPFSMADTCSFAVMTREHMHTAFTFDRHFQVAGFARWM